MKKVASGNNGRLVKINLKSLRERAKVSNTH